MTVYQVSWGDALVVQVFRAEGGLKAAVETVRSLLGPAIGTRNTFAKLLRIDDPLRLSETDRFRAWLLITALGADPVEFGLDDEAVPRAYDVERLRSDLYTTRDSNPEPIDLAFWRGSRALADRASVSLSTIIRMERPDYLPSLRAVQLVEDALLDAELPAIEDES